MRHNKNFNHLGRQAGHRKAMLSNMASSLILHKRIETTLAKAKAVRMFVEPLVTKSKEDTTHSRRVVFSYLKQKEAVTELFRTIAPKIAERPGGYTRILKTGFPSGVSISKSVNFWPTAVAFIFSTFSLILMITSSFANSAGICGTSGSSSSTSR